MIQRYDAQLRELARLQEDMLYTEKAYFAAEHALRRTHIIVGCAATIAAIAAAATLLSTHPTVTGSLALTAAALSGYLTFRKPEQEAAEALRAGRSLGALRVRCRQMANLTLGPGATLTQSDANELVSKITAEIAEAQAKAPPVANRHFTRGRSRISDGYFQHKVDSNPANEPGQQR